ncbi:spore germination protein [Paenibacillus filicis]|uniref:Spore germination protein n=1 Tax=Paenibacillus filicis TaxID=669464 RepID=A0ABU9DE59_9BACL
MAQNVQPDRTAGGYTLCGAVNEDVLKFQTVFNKCADIHYRNVEMNGGKKGALIFLCGLVDIKSVDLNIMRQLTECRDDFLEQPGPFTADMKTKIQNQLIYASQAGWVGTFDETVEHILAGDVALLLDGLPEVLVIHERHWEKRSIEEPATEAVIRGPREGFQESLGTNISLIRRRLKTPSLKMEEVKVGRLSNTEIAIVYLEGIADKALVREVKERIGRIKIDAILESGYIEELIEDHALSPFPQVLVTERPDRVVGNLLEGKVAIIIDNTPFVLLVPGTFFELLQSPEDYYQRYFIASSIRMLRLLAVISSLLLPSLYIALTTFHHEMIPTMLLISIASARETVPFPAFVEALLMEVAFEGLREAGVRLPRPVGQAVSIVGALVIGQAAVAAGIVSSPLVIIVSMTGIASFIFPSFQLGLAFRLLRFPMMIAAAALGLYGILMLLLMLLLHMLHLRSFGVPYMTPLAPLRMEELQDVIIRANWPNMMKHIADTKEKRSGRISNPFALHRQRSQK